MPKVLITGVNGFVGKHLARELNSQGCEVMGIGQDPDVDPSIKDCVGDYYSCDLTDEDTVANLPLLGIKAVIGLAGLANVGASFDKPDLYNHVNVAVLSVIGERLLAIGSIARVIAVSTGAVYSTDQSLPLAEDSQLITDGSPYALSKIAMEKAATDLRERGLNCVVVRPFNHIGPGQEPGFLVPDLYQKIMEARKIGILKVGPLSTRRDYTDVRDVVRAYAALAQADRLDHGVYNVCTGRSVEGKRILDLLLEETGLVEKITVEKDASFKPRPNDPADLYGSNERLRTQTGWQPIIRIEQTITDFVAGRAS